MREGAPGGSVGEASAFGPSRDLRVLRPRPLSGSMLSGEPASLSGSAPAHVLSQINKILKKKSEGDTNTLLTNTS